VNRAPVRAAPAPRLKRRPAPAPAFAEERGAPAPALLTAEGVFVPLDCPAGPARLILSIRGKETAFAIRNPRPVMIEDDTGAAMEFTCGRQKARRVILEYRPLPDTKLGNRATPPRSASPGSAAAYFRTRNTAISAIRFASSATRRRPARK
jgi:hypothetical protein